MNLSRPVDTYLSRLLPIPTGLAAYGVPVSDINCILFDIYGTLFVSGSGDIGISRKARLQKSQLDLFTAYGVKKPPDKILKSFFSAIEARHIELKKRSIQHPEVVIEKIWMDVLGISDLKKAKRFALEYELITNPVWPMPGLSELINTCKKRNIAMGIISNAQFYTPLLFKWFLKTDLNGLGFDPDLLFFSYKTANAKPSTHMFDLAVGNLLRKSIKPETVLYVGNDMLNDMMPAQKTGFRTCLFAGDQRSLRLRTDHPLCKSLKPDAQIIELCQLL